MQENLLSTVVMMRRELQLVTKSLEKLSKTYGQRLKEDWQRKQDVLKILGCSMRTLDRLTSSGLLPYSKINGLIYIKTADIEKLLNDNRS